MAWNILFDEDFASWLDAQELDVRTAIRKHLVLLEERGPNLARPYVDAVKGSDYSNLKELRVQIGGDP